MRTTDKPFSIRPTEGTALQRFIDLCRAKQLSPKPAIEEWARLAEQSQRKDGDTP